jgi:hypothetical protein
MKSATAVAGNKISGRDSRRFGHSMMPSRPRLLSHVSLDPIEESGRSGRAMHG